MTRLSLYHALKAQLAAAGITEAEAEATLLLCHLLSCRRSDIFLQGDLPVPPAAQQALTLALQRRLSREPLAYVLGEQEFYGRSFTVSPAVLIPRPETELLVERALALLSGGVWHTPVRVLDLGVGSGVIGITLAAELPQVTVFGVDLSLAALQVARANASRQRVADRMYWLNANWGESLRGEAFDLVVANPPYVAGKVRETLQPELAAEPALALYGGEDGRQAIDQIMGDVARLLRPGGTLLMEIGYDQGAYVAATMEALRPWTGVMVHDDYARLPRVVQAQRRDV